MYSNFHTTELRARFVRVLPFLFCFIITIPPLFGQVGLPDITTIRTNWREAQHIVIDTSILQKTLLYASTIREDGSWADIPYQSTASYVEFQPREHLNRLYALSITARWADAEATRLLCSKAFSLGARYWIQQCPKGANGWYNEIDAPNYLGLSALVVSDLLDQSTLTSIVNYIKSFSDWPILNYSGKLATGQNLLWKAKGQMLAGLLDGDTAYYTWAESQFLKAFQITTTEGIQSDLSFHQHGPQLYSGSYGRSTLIEGASVLKMIALGAKRTYPQIEDLSDFLLNGERWFVYQGIWDFNAVGRDIGRDLLPDIDLAKAASALVPVSISRKAELTTLLANCSSAGALPPFSGSKYFWRSDTAIFRNVDWYASIRAASTRTFGSESGNGEGLLNFHMGSGSTCLMRNGTEYTGIFPLWNWTLVPGVTCLYQDPESLPLIDWGTGSAGGSAFVGGLASNDGGIAAMKLLHGGVSGKKAWFYINNRLVCLGADISTSDTSTIVATSVDQCWAIENAKIDGSPILTGTTKVLVGETPVQVINGGFSYYFPQGGKIHISRTYRTAPWTRINQGAPAYKNASGDLFRLWIDHGTTPHNGAYAYIVSPYEKPQDVAIQVHVGDANPPTVGTEAKILKNDAQIQSVTNTDKTIVQIVFWSSGILDVPGWIRIESDTPAIVQATHTPEGITLLVQNPVQDARTIRVSITPLDFNSQPTKATQNAYLVYSSSDPTHQAKTIDIRLP